VIGAGYGGATAARHIRLLDPSIEVVLVEREGHFVSAPLSNLVVGGSRSIDEISRGYDGLRRHGVQVVHDQAVAIDAEKKTVRLGRGGNVGYERLIVSPGVDFFFDQVAGYAAALQSGHVLHAWQTGPQIAALRSRLEAMPDGGVFLLSVPEAPLRCPAAPYERACQVAYYFKQAKPRAKVLLLDANPEVLSNGPLFRRAWEELYPGIIDYQASANVIGVDAATMSARTEFDTFKADVLNVIPPQRAADIARQAGLMSSANRWCDVDWRTLESKKVGRVHVLGDATLAASGMPKSGHMANSQGKVCAAAVVALLNGREPEAEPGMSSSCYSFVSEREAVHIASVHRWVAAQQTILPVKGAGSASAARSEQEGIDGWSWARNIWADMLS